MSFHTPSDDQQHGSAYSSGHEGDPYATQEEVSDLERDAAQLTQSIDSMPESSSHVVEPSVEKKSSGAMTKILMGVGVLVLVGGAYVGWEMMSASSPAPLAKKQMPVERVETVAATAAALELPGATTPAPVAPAPAAEVSPIAQPVQDALPAPVFGMTSTSTPGTVDPLAPTAPAPEAIPSVPTATATPSPAMDPGPAPLVTDTKASPSNTEAPKALETVKPVASDAAPVTESKPVKKVVKKKPVQKKKVEQKAPVAEASALDPKRTDANSVDSKYWKPMF